MNRRTEVDGEGDDAKPNVAHTCSGRRLDTVIPFPRSVEAAASCGPAASSPSSADGLDAFISVGEAVAAVVMSLRGGFPRVKVLVPAKGGDSRDET